MTTGNAMGSGAKAAIAILGLVGLAVLGNFVFRSDQLPAPEPAANLTSAPSPEASGSSSTEASVANGVTVPEPASPAEPAAEPPAELVAVTIENWRVEADGAALLSGRAAPLAVLSVFVDGTKLTEGAATAAGDFVLMFTVPPNENPSLLTIEAVLPDGKSLPAPAAIALSPIAGPAVEVAAAEPAAPDGTEDAAKATADDAQATVAEEAKAADAPTAVMVTEEGAKVVSAAPATETAPGEAAPVTIAAIAYTPDGHVQLSGLGQAGQTVRLYLDNALTAETPVLPDNSWQVVLTETPPGIYTLRADQIDASGKVTARFETPFKRETPEALAALAEPKAEPAPEATVVAAADTQTGDDAESKASAENTSEQPVSGEPQVANASEGAAAASEEAAPVEEEAAETDVVTPTSETVATATEEPAKAAEADAPAGESTETQVAVSEPAVTEPIIEPTTVAENNAPSAETTAPDPTSSNAQQPAPTAPESVNSVPASAGASSQPAQPSGETGLGKVPQTVSITVQPGYSLWKIARDTYGDGILYVQVYEANKEQIGDPDLIYPGQVFELPVK